MSNVIKFSFKSEAAPLFLIILSFLASFYFYKNFPETVPVHWNMDGVADSWGSSFKAAFTFPVINIGIYLIFLILPRVDPKKERYKQFTRTYNVLKTAIIAFLTIIYIVSSLSALAYDINVTRVVTILVGILFIVIGNYMSKIKRNWFLGIRTPWTLSSEDVWNKTHRLGGKMFIFSGLLMASISFLNSKYQIPLLIISVLSTSLVSVAYSFYLYTKEEKEKNGNK